MRLRSGALYIFFEYEAILSREHITTIPSVMDFDGVVRKRARKVLLIVTGGTLCMTRKADGEHTPDAGILSHLKACPASAAPQFGCIC